MTHFSSTNSIVLCADSQTSLAKIQARVTGQFANIGVTSLAHLETTLQRSTDATVVVFWRRASAELSLVAGYCRANNLPLIVVLGEFNSNEINKINESNDLVVLNESAIDSLEVWVDYAKHIRQHAAQMQQQIDLLNRKLEERRCVEKAKGLLMKSHSLDESQAYKALRSTSMKSSQPMIDIARNVISSLERLN